MNIQFVNYKKFEIEKNDFSVSEETGEMIKGEKKISVVYMGSVSFSPDRIIDFLKNLEKQCTIGKREVYIYENSTCEDFCYAIV